MKILLCVVSLLLIGCNENYVRPENIVNYNYHIKSMIIEGRAYPKGVTVFNGFEISFNESEKSILPEAMAMVLNGGLSFVETPFILQKHLRFGN